MNILLTSEFYHPRVGGAEKVVQIIAEGLAEKGHTVTVATTKIAGRTSFVLNGVKVIEFNIFGNAAKSITEKTKGDIDRYKALLLGNSFDVLLQYAAQTWHTDLAFPILDHVQAKKIFVPCGFSGLTTLLRRLLYYRYFKKMPQYLKKYDELVFLSENYLDTKFAKEHGAGDYSIIPNGIFRQEFDENKADFRKEFNIPPDKRIVLNVSNHYKLKGHGQLAKAFQAGDRKASEVLVIIGNDPGGRTSCKKDCEELQKVSDNILMLSNVPRELVISAYKQCDLFVLSSYIEYYPLVLIEAMYCKKPIVSMNVGCVEDYCDCILVDNYDDLSLAIDTALNSSQAHKIDNNFSKVVNELVWEKIIDNYNALIVQ